MSASSGIPKTPVVDLGALLDAGDGAVVTLLAGETRLAAHRAVLAARSPVFSAMFQHETLEAASGEVAIVDVEGLVLRQLLAYCYTLQAPQLPDMAPQLLVAADKYGLPALKGVCEQQVAAKLTVELAAATAVVAVRHSCPSLTAAAIDFIRANPQVMATQGWADAVLTSPKDIVEVSRLLGELQGESRMPADATPGSHRQPHRDHGSRAPATAAAPTAPRHAAPPYDTAVSRFRRLSQQEKNRRLVQAAEQGAVRELRALLAAGADVAARDGNRWTALHWAADRGHEAAARCLVEAGAEVGARGGRQETPLHCAALRGHAAVVRLLLAASADPNARDQLGVTPLHVAAFRGQSEAAAALLHGGADRGARANGGPTPLDLARQNNHHQLIQLLTP